MVISLLGALGPTLFSLCSGHWAVLLHKRYAMFMAWHSKGIVSRVGKKFHVHLCCQYLPAREAKRATAKGRSVGSEGSPVTSPLAVWHMCSELSELIGLSVQFQKLGVNATTTLPLPPAQSQGDLRLYEGRGILLKVDQSWASMGQFQPCHLFPMPLCTATDLARSQNCKHSPGLPVGVEAESMPCAYSGLCSQAPVAALGPVRVPVQQLRLGAQLHLACRVGRSR